MSELKNYCHNYLIIQLRILITILFFSGDCFAVKPDRTISTNQEYFFNLSDHPILFDPTGKLTIDNVQQLPESSFSFNPGKFNPAVNRNLWLKLNLSVKDSLENKWIFELFNQQAEEIIIYACNGNNKYIAVDTIGAGVPFYERNLHERFPAFEIPLKAGHNTVYIKYRSEAYLGLTAIMQPYRSYINFSNQYYFVIGGFYFVLLILLLYNFLFFLSTRDKIYLYYILFVVASALDCLKVDQIGFALFWPDYPVVNFITEKTVRVLFIFGVINYASYFLSVKKDFPRLHKLVWITFSLLTIHHLVLGEAFPGFAYGLWITDALILALLMMILWVAIVRLKQNHKPSRIFIIGYTSILTGFVVTYMFYSGWIEGNHFVYFVLFYGIAIDTFMFSFALSSRLRHERMEKERALAAENEARSQQINLMMQNETLLNKVNAELEEKVRERTVEIEESKLRLAEQAEIIRKLNIGLDKENWNLNKTVKSLKIRKIIPENQTYAQMQELFKSESDCYTFLADYKWSEGFRCRKCANTKESKISDFYSRRCTRCGTSESITAHTIFHKLKFPLDKAFYIAYSVFVWKEKLNVSDLAREIDLNYKTSLKFKLKIEEAMESRKKDGIKIKSWEDLIIEN